jgi:hypothetical protein
MSYWPIVKNQKDVDAYLTTRCNRRLLLAIEKAVDDWKSFYVRCQQAGQQTTLPGHRVCFRASAQSRR